MTPPLSRHLDNIIDAQQYGKVLAAVAIYNTLGLVRQSNRYAVIREACIDILRMNPVTVDALLRELCVEPNRQYRVLSQNVQGIVVSHMFEGAQGALPPVKSSYTTLQATTAKLESAKTLRDDIRDMANDKVNVWIEYCEDEQGDWQALIE